MKHILATAVAFQLLIGCASRSERDADISPRETVPHAAPPWAAAGPITIDGSSTVHPVTRAIAAEFDAKRGANVQVAFSGTGGGFRKFCAGEITINGASRPMTAAEVDACRRGGIRYVELPIALDGIVVAVHPKNDWAASITASELKRLWEPAAERKIMRWSQVRKGWPDTEIHLYGAGADSGTYDYFTAAIVGAEHSSRIDYAGSEDDDVLVESVATDPQSLGFFGLGYYEKNKARIKAVAVDDEKDTNGAGAVLPSTESITGGAYQPLTRPMFIYVSLRDAARPEVTEFVRFFLREASANVRNAGYVALPARTYELVQSRFDHRIVGSLFKGHGSTIGVKATDLTAAE